MTLLWPALRQVGPAAHFLKHFGARAVGSLLYPALSVSLLLGREGTADGLPGCQGPPVAQEI